HAHSSTVRSQKAVRRVPHASVDTGRHHERPVLFEIERRVERDRPPAIETLLNDLAGAVTADWRHDAQRLRAWLVAILQSRSQPLQQPSGLGARHLVAGTHPNGRGAI